MATPPVPTPERKSTWVVWLLGLLAAGLVVLVGGALLLSVYVARQVEIQRAGNQVEIRTPVGEVKVSKSEQAHAGLPVYPGATLLDPAAQVEVMASAEESVSVVAARYRTTDPIEKVDDWYREHLGSEFVREGPGVMDRKKKVFGIQVKSDDVAFISEKDDVLRVVALERKLAAVEIALVRIGHDQPQ